ncbi:MAG: DNA polymerase III subunit alpha [Clostridiales bacterium]|jgi:DNA polymerase-3 subunit alpha|nr:DNA polymerase III subunit alpha [Clostridiales bacterium]
MVHLHNHTVYSLLDGACKIEELVARAKSLGQKALAITDHGVMYGAIDFYKECKKQGIKPILGCEVYVAARSLEDKDYEKDHQSNHLVLLAENMQGFKNLMKLVTIAHTQGFYYRPRVDKDTLKKYSKGLIALSGCMAGELSRAILAGLNSGGEVDLSAAREVISQYIDIFGKDNYFIEVQNHLLPEQPTLIKALSELSAEFDVDMVATNDVHYINAEDADVQDVLLCIQTGKKLSDTDRFKFESDQLYLKDGEEMNRVLGQVKGAIDNTEKIAERCNVEITFAEYHLPKFSVPNGVDSYDYLKELCERGLRERYANANGKVDDNVRARMEHELDVINSMGFVDYFLIVQDFIAFAKSQDIMVGPGRGSAAGSVVAYCLGITDVDPIEYSLIFERFLNPERVTMPDIDIDFCYRRRREVIDYVVDKYGANNVAQIVTFGTMQPRLAIRDCGRVLDAPYALVDQVAKLIPTELKITLADALIKEPKLQELYDNEPEVKRLIDTALKLEGVPRHTSTHAGGVVVTEKELAEYVPLTVSDNWVTTQWTMTTIEELGLLKMDFLGLRTLTVIKDTLDMVRGVSGDANDTKLLLDDKPTYEMLQRGDTDGVFQLESPGMKSFMRELQPRAIDDIIAGISLYRPGPMDAIPVYIFNRNNPNKVEYKHPLLEPILKTTYGCVVYQEQVMQIVQSLAGYSLGRADVLRRAMSKKKADVMERERDVFINGLINEKGEIEVDGAVRRGVAADVASSIFDEMIDFSKYAFNKSHSVAYAMISYQTAYLKVHYPTQFFCALLTSEIENTNKVTKYINTARDNGIQVLPASVQESGVGFTPLGDEIRFGLVAIKNVGSGLAENIISERTKNGKYTSLTNFLERMMPYNINKKAVEFLIKAGALDEFGGRAQMIAMYETLMNRAQTSGRKNVEGQVSLFDLETGDEDIFGAVDDELPDVPEYDYSILLSLEREATGVFVSGNPLDAYKDVLDNYKTVDVSDILDKNVEDGANEQIVGSVVSVRKKASRSGEMAFIKLQDLTGVIEVVVFAKIYGANASMLVENAVVSVSGRVSQKDDEAPSFIMQKCRAVNKDGSGEGATAGENLQEREKFFIKVKNSEQIDEITEILKFFKGNVPVYLYNEEDKKTMLAPKGIWVQPCDALVRELELIGAESKVQ